MRYSIIALICVCTALSSTVFGQKNMEKDKTKMTFEAVKKVCKGTPLNERPRITVARFEVATPKASREFGGELATMLSNALQQTSCYRVLESIDNFEDMKGEIDLGNSGYVKSSSGPKAGQMMGAQFIITGEITEYNLGKTGIKLAGVGFGGGKASIGFIIKVVNPATREIIFSESFNTEGRKGFQGISIFGFETTGASFDNKAVADAAEKGIIKAVEFLSREKDNLLLDGDSDALRNGTASNAFSNIELSNATFAKVRSLEQKLKGISTVKSVDKTFSGSQAKFQISHAGSTDDLLDSILGKMGSQVEVTGYESNFIALKAR